MDVSASIKVARLTDIGLHRDHNEDVVASDLSIGLLVLADGMGGYRAGEVASEVAALTIAAEITESMLKRKFNALAGSGKMVEGFILADAVKKANQAIYQISQQEPQCAGMGTTLVACLFADNQLVVGHIGDSRLYCLRNGVLEQLTQDHSLLQEQLDAGIISEEQAKMSIHKNLVTRALGVGPDAELDLQEFDVKVGDIYLLCSDGLTDMLDNEEIKSLLLTSETSLEFAAANLVRAANDAGGKDNISVIVAAVNAEFKAKKSWANFFKAT